MMRQLTTQAGPFLEAPRFNRSLRRLQFRGLFLILLFVGGFAVWSATTVLMGAVAASGQFVVAGDVKRVQSLNGGIVKDLLVREGDHVEAGQVLLRLDPTLLLANRQILAKQSDETAIRRARLEAERDDRTALDVPAVFAARRDDPEVARLISSETHLMDVRREAMDGRRAQLVKQVEQANEAVAGYNSQLVAARKQAVISADELKTVEALYAKKLVQYSRYSLIQREVADVEGRIGQIEAAIAANQGKASEVELQILQLGEDRRSEVTAELRDVQAREGELTERLTAAQDQLARVDLRAPVAGIVHQLQIHTIGGVVPPGEAVMSVVPVGDDLQIEAVIAPTDIDQVTLGQPARIRLHAGNQRMMPELQGQVTLVGADTRRDERTGMSFYTVRVSVPPDELRKVEPLRVIVGMQAQVYIETSERSPIDFLLKPLEEQVARTFRER